MNNLRHFVNSKDIILPINYLCGFCNCPTPAVNTPMNTDSFRDKKILITGATGLIGSALVRYLAESGASVRAAYRNRKPSPEIEGVEYLKADLTQAEDCRKVMEGIDYVFHCASNTPGAASTTNNPLAYVTSNLIIDARVFEAAYNAGVKKLLWLGSTTGYPPTGERPVKEEEMFDGDPFEKYFFMGWTKRFTEVLARMYGERLPRPMTTIVLRPTNVYGPRDNFDPEKSRVIPALIRKVVERMLPLEVWGTGDDMRDSIYVDDVIDAMMLAMAKVEKYNTFNIGFGKNASVKEILQMILELDGYENAEITFNTSKPTMIPVRKVDISKAKSVLGFEAKTDLRAGLKKTIEWYRKTFPQL